MYIYIFIEFNVSEEVSIEYLNVRVGHDSHVMCDVCLERATQHVTLTTMAPKVAPAYLLASSASTTTTATTQVVPIVTTCVASRPIYPSD